MKNNISVNGFLLGFAILLSGFSALAYQVAWQRALTQSIGSDSVSVVLIVTIFMVWLGVGAAFARVLIKQSRRRMAKTYAGIEVLVGVFGIFSIPMIRFVNSGFAETGFDSLSADFAVNLFLLGLPIVGMGMTTPLIVQMARESLSNFGRTVGLLYGLNILGASLGAVVCGLVLLESLGLDGATVLAGCLNMIAAAAAFFAFNKAADSKIESQPIAPSRSSSWGWVDLVAILFGFGTLALQVIFFRVLHAYFTLSTIVFPIVLCVYLLLMAFGQWLGGVLADKYHLKLVNLCVILFFCGSLLVAASLNISPSWVADFGAFRFTTFNGSLLNADHRHLIGDPPIFVVFAFSAVFMASVVAWSALFPVLLKLATLHIDAAGESFGRMYSMYTIGNVAGTFATGAVLLALFGTGFAAISTIVIVGLGSLLLLVSVGLRSSKFAATVVVTGVLVAAFIPQDYYRLFRLDAYRVSEVFEGKVGVVTVSPTSKFYSIVDISRTASASALVRDPSPGDEYQAWRWNHAELMALDPNFRPKRVLVVGLGHGYLPHALLDHPFIEEIVVVDLSQEIVDAVRQHTRTDARRIFSDPRVKILIADGRRYVQSAIKKGEKFDLIQIKINEPWHAGSGNLFTQEFFEMTKRLLSDGGYLGVRPLVGHLHDGLNVFSEAVYPGFYHLFFKNGSMGRPNAAAVTADIYRAYVRELPGQDVVSSSYPKVMNAMYFDRVPDWLDIDANTDNRPTFEYYWLRKNFGKWKSPQVSLSGPQFQVLGFQVPVTMP